MSEPLPDSMVIAYQARRLVTLEERVRVLTERIEAARMHIICIGGPLNDNKLCYTKEQLVTFAKIEEELDLCPLPTP